MIKKIKDILLIFFIIFSFVTVYLYINKVKDHGAIEAEYNLSEKSNDEFQKANDLLVKDKVLVKKKYEEKLKLSNDKKPEKVIITKWKKPEKIIEKEIVYVKIPEADYIKLENDNYELQISFNIKVDKIKWLENVNKENEDLIKIKDGKYAKLFNSKKIANKFVKVLKKREKRFVFTFGGFVNPSGTFSVGLGFGVKILSF